MSRWRLFSLTILVITCVISSENSNIGLNTVQLIKKFGYPAETHYVKSQDGYILGLHRIPFGLKNNTRESRSAILLVPGLTISTAEFVNFVDPSQSLGYILADGGYDVWLSENRGSIWSRNHTYLNPNIRNKKFWDFSWHEIGHYDLPAIIDYILNVTNETNLYFVGHSLGSTVFFVMATTRPEYNSKIKLAMLLAPTVFLKNVDSLAFKFLGIFRSMIQIWSTDEKVYEFPPYSDLLRKFLSKICRNPDNLNLCSLIIHSIGMPDNFQLNLDNLPVFFTNTPTGSSIKEFLHYAQIYRTKKFAQFNYGLAGNLKKYGTKKPPMYNLSKITAPIGLYYGRNDAIVSLDEIHNLINLLPSVVINYLVPYNFFNHIDFILANDAHSLVYKKLLKDIKKFH